MHTLFDLKATIPSVLFISEGKMHDILAADFLLLGACAFYILDPGYISASGGRRWIMSLGSTGVACILLQQIPRCTGYS